MFSVSKQDGPDTAMCNRSCGPAYGRELALKSSESHRALLQFARQGPAMHAEAAGCFRDIAAGFGQHLVDPLPFQRLEVAAVRQERAERSD